MKAAEIGHTDVVGLLPKSAYDWRAPLYRAVKNGHLRAVRAIYLKRKICSMEAVIWGVFQCAAKFGQSEIISWMLGLDFRSRQQYS